MHRRTLIAIFALVPVAAVSAGRASRSVADDGESGGSDGGGESSGSGVSSGGSDSSGSISSDPEAARRAVEDKTAIPLKDMMDIFSALGAGEVVDVSLIRGSGGLRYRFKYIDSQGHVRRAYFDARTGRRL